MITSALAKMEQIWRRQGRWLDGFLRRGLDIAAALLGLFFLAPVFAFIAVLIKRDSPGPIHYWGPRVGRGEKPFRILKFRTMYEIPTSYQGPKVTAQGDRRITPVGTWLRDTKLNELPQLWNVLKGEMSLVGPRPEDPDFVEAWPIEMRSILLSVRPGLTSPATVLYRDEETLLGKMENRESRVEGRERSNLDPQNPAVGNSLIGNPQTGNPVDHYLRSILPDKLRLDERYLQHRTLLTDLDVLFWTLIALLPQLRRRPIPKPGTAGLPSQTTTRLYWGPFSVFAHRIFNWFAADFLVALFSVGAAGALWRLGAPFHLGWSHAIAVALAQALLFSLVNTVLGIHRVYWAKAPAGDALDLAVSSGLSLAGLFALNFWAWPAWLSAAGRTTPAPLPLPMLAFSGLLAFGGFVAIRYRERLITGFATRWLRLRGGRGLGLVRVLVVGAGEAARFGIWLLQKSDLAQAFTIAGLVDDDPRKQGLRIEGHPVLGTTADLPTLVERYEIGLVMFAISRITAHDRARILALCTQTGAHVVRVPDLITILSEYFVPAPHSDIGQAPVSLPSTHPDAPLRTLDALLAAGDVDAARAYLRDLARDGELSVEKSM